jgi:hypothetical protein
MLFAVFYLLLRRLVALAGGSAEDRHRDVEVWSFVISSPSSGAVLAGRAFAAAIGCSWLR